MRTDNRCTATLRALTRIFPNVTVLVMVFGILAAPVRAGIITGSFDGVSTLTPTDAPGIFIQHFTGDGDDTIFGAFAATSTSTINFSHPPNIVVTDVMLTQDFGDKGSLTGTGSGGATGNGQGVANFTFEFTVTGGTGIFAHDIGTVTVTGTITQDSPTMESIDAAYTGSLASVPEPSILILTAAGLIGCGLRRKASRLSGIRRSG
jgi:hypothetical protein